MTDNFPSDFGDIYYNAHAFVSFSFELTEIFK